MPRKIRRDEPRRRPQKSKRPVQKTSAAQRAIDAYAYLYGQTAAMQ
jgi:hypothetical protein